MRPIRWFAVVVVVAMLAAILGAATTASLPEDGSILLGLAWGRVTLIDLYLAFAIVWLWIAYREASPRRSVAWLVATIVTGSLALGIYLLVAARRATTPLELLVGPRRLAHLGMQDPPPETPGSGRDL